MYQKFNFTIATLVMAAGIGFTAADAMGQVTMQFPVNRDVGIDAWSRDDYNPNLPFGQNFETLSNAGTADFSIPDGGEQGSVRARKSDQHGMVLDFDTAAMDAFLQANPGTATWTFNIRNASDAGQQVLPTDPVTIVTVESTNDWAEGDGTINFLNYNWTSGTAAATYFYAQTIYNEVDGEDVLDTTNSLQWIDPDSGPYVFTTRAALYEGSGVPDTVGIGLVADGAGVPGVSVGPTPEFTNAASYSVADIQAALDSNGFATADLDTEIVDALIEDENNRGLRFGPLGISSDGSSFVNWSIFTRECDSATLGQCAPFLEVTIMPAAGQEGDFDGDQDVDGADFLEWQRTLGDATSLGLWEGNYGTTASTASAAGVPEPSSLLLVLLCSSAMLCTRCGNRKAA